MIKFILILIPLLLTSCVHLSFNNVQQLPNPRNKPIDTGDDIVCKNKDVLKLKHYKKPEVPDVDTLPPGDRKAEILMLLDYIDELSADIDELIIDYECE